MLHACFCAKRAKRSLARCGRCWRDVRLRCVGRLCARQPPSGGRRADNTQNVRSYFRTANALRRVCTHARTTAIAVVVETTSTTATALSALCRPQPAATSPGGVASSIVGRCADTQTLHNEHEKRIVQRTRNASFQTGQRPLLTIRAICFEGLSVFSKRFRVFDVVMTSSPPSSCRNNVAPELPLRVVWKTCAANAGNAA